MGIDNDDPEESNRNDEEVINDGVDDKLDVPEEVIYITFIFHLN